jgi:hypothetical protein
MCLLVLIRGLEALGSYLLFYVEYRTYLLIVIKISHICVRTACLELLPSYPGQDFVILTLQTLTNLAKQTLIHIPDQVGCD